MTVCSQCARQMQAELVDTTLVCQGTLRRSVGPLFSGAVRGRHTSVWHNSWPPITLRQSATDCPPTPIPNIKNKVSQSQFEHTRGECSEIGFPHLIGARSQRCILYATHGIYIVNILAPEGHIRQMCIG